MNTMLQIGRFIIRHQQNFGNKPLKLKLKGFSTVVTKVSTEEVTLAKDEQPSKNNGVKSKATVRSAGSRNMVASVFANLKKDTKANEEISLDERLLKAKSVDELLALSNGVGVSRTFALKVVSMLADWSASGKVQLADFDTDQRFLKLCRALGRNGKSFPDKRASENDLSMVLSVASDDEAAKLVSGISPQQMIRVLSMLAQKKRRSVPLLRSISNHLSRSAEPLDAKRCSDVLYALARLSYPERVLVDRVCVDLTKDLGERSAAVGSAITSLGILRYRSAATLDSLAEWMVSKKDVCRAQDVAALVVTLAMLNFTPANSEQIFQTIVPQLNQAEAKKPSAWLDVVWSLLVLGQATAKHLESILDPLFVERVIEENQGSSVVPKLLNANAAAKLLVKNYTGPFLSDQIKSEIGRSKEKQDLCASVFDTMNHMAPAEKYLKCSTETGMGFLIDCECYFDAKHAPMPYEAGKQMTSAKRVALLTMDFHDMTKGEVEPTGHMQLAANLLKAKGYCVVLVPYTDFNPREKLIRRLQYLDTEIKTVLTAKH